MRGLFLSAIKTEITIYSNLEEESEKPHSLQQHELLRLKPEFSILDPLALESDSHDHIQDDQPLQP